MMSKRISRLSIGFAILFGCAISMPALADVIYVDDDVASGDGLSWATAYSDIQDALILAVSGDDIWVAAGTYVPGDATTDSYNMKNGVDLYGSFAGDENPATFDLADRDFDANATILSGQVAEGTTSKIVYASNLSTPPVLNGFVMTDASRSLWCTSTDMIIESCVISNSVNDGMYSTSGSNPVITDCIIENNGSRGVWFNGVSSPTITNSIIRNNGQEGLYCYGRGTTITNCWIDHNGMDGVYFYSPDDRDIVRNNTIVYNTDSGIYN
ncbi:MAG: right-handed parallel beta-helix repeat-containing protein, partial [Planctomycetes bacterium]|nr:right-handed parallel beta-helix repeat-containing protein [Planctomycetota bacterium]